MKNKFARNLGIMGVIGILIKIIGALYRVPLAHFMSENAVAYYALAYPWYNILIVISSTAIPAVIAKLTAESIALKDNQGKMAVFQVSRMLMNLFGLVSALFLIGFAGVISRALGFPESVYAFYVLGIASYFVALNAAYRGFFQGDQRLELFGLSQLLEQIGRVVFGLSAVVLLSGLAFGDGALAGAGTSGAAFGAIVSWLYSLNRFKKHYPSSKIEVADPKKVAMKILRLVGPIAIGASMMPLLSMIDGVMVVWRLRQIGMEAVAGILYSYVSFYSAPIINISQVVFAALQLSLLPMITNSFTQKSQALKKQVGLGVLLSVALGLPMGLGMAAFAEPILLFLYPSKADIVVDAAPVLALLSIAIIFLSVYLSTTSILQGMNAYKAPVKHLMIGAVVKLVSAYVLIGIPSINVNGAAISTLLAYLVAAVLNLSLVFKMQRPDGEALKKLSLVVISNVLMILSARLVYGLLITKVGMTTSLLLAILVAIIVYSLLVVSLKLISKKDFENL